MKIKPPKKKPERKYAHRNTGPNRKERWELYKAGVIKFSEATRAYNKPYRKPA